MARIFDASPQDLFRQKILHDKKNLVKSEFVRTRRNVPNIFFNSKINVNDIKKFESSEERKAVHSTDLIKKSSNRNEDISLRQTIPYYMTNLQNSYFMEVLRLHLRETHVLHNNIYTKTVKDHFFIPLISKIKNLTNIFMDKNFLDSSNGLIKPIVDIKIDNSLPITLQKNKGDKREEVSDDKFVFGSIPRIDKNKNKPINITMLEKIKALWLTICNNILVELLKFYSSLEIISKKILLLRTILTTKNLIGTQIHVSSLEESRHLLGLFHFELTKFHNHVIDVYIYMVRDLYKNEDNKIYNIEDIMFGYVETYMDGTHKEPFKKYMYAILLCLQLHPEWSIEGSLIHNILRVLVYHTYVIDKINDNDSDYDSFYKYEQTKLNITSKEITKSKKYKHLQYSDDNQPLVIKSPVSISVFGSISDFEKWINDFSKHLHLNDLKKWNFEPEEEIINTTKSQSPSNDIYLYPEFHIFDSDIDTKNTESHSNLDRSVFDDKLFSNVTGPSLERTDGYKRLSIVQNQLKSQGMLTNINFVKLFPTRDVVANKNLLDNIKSNPDIIKESKSKKSTLEVMLTPISEKESINHVYTSVNPLDSKYYSSFISKHKPKVSFFTSTFYRGDQKNYQQEYFNKYSYNTLDKGSFSVEDPYSILKILPINNYSTSILENNDIVTSKIYEYDIWIGFLTKTPDVLSSDLNETREVESEYETKKKFGVSTVSRLYSSEHEAILNTYNEIFGPILNYIPTTLSTAMIDFWMASNKYKQLYAAGLLGLIVGTPTIFSFGPTVITALILCVGIRYTFNNTKGIMDFDILDYIMKGVSFVGTFIQIFQCAPAVFKIAVNFVGSQLGITSLGAIINLQEIAQIKNTAVKIIADIIALSKAAIFVKAFINTASQLIKGALTILKLSFDPIEYIVKVVVGKKQDGSHKKTISNILKIFRPLLKFIYSVLLETFEYGLTSLVGGLLSSVFQGFINLAIDPPKIDPSSNTTQTNSTKPPPDSDKSTSSEKFSSSPLPKIQNDDELHVPTNKKFKDSFHPVGEVVHPTENLISSLKEKNKVMKIPKGTFTSTDVRSVYPDEKFQNKINEILKNPSSYYSKSPNDQRIYMTNPVTGKKLGIFSPTEFKNLIQQGKIRNAKDVNFSLEIDPGKEWVLDFGTSNTERLNKILAIFGITMSQYMEVGKDGITSPSELLSSKFSKVDRVNDLPKIVPKSVSTHAPEKSLLYDYKDAAVQFLDSTRYYGTLYGPTIATTVAGAALTYGASIYFDLATVALPYVGSFFLGQEVAAGSIYGLTAGTTYVTTSIAGAASGFTFGETIIDKTTSFISSIPSVFTFESYKHTKPINHDILNKKIPNTSVNYKFQINQKVDNFINQCFSINFDKNLYNNQTNNTTFNNANTTLTTPKISKTNTNPEEEIAFFATVGSYLYKWVDFRQFYNSDGSKDQKVILQYQNNLKTSPNSNTKVLDTSTWTDVIYNTRNMLPKIMVGK